MKGAFQKFRSFFIKDKNRKVYCHHCGEHVVAEFYRCPACRKWRRSVFAVIVGTFFYLYGTLVYATYLWKILPAIEGYLKESEFQMMSFVRFSIAFSNFVANYPLMVYSLIGVLAAYLVFIWKPHKSWGINLFLILTVIYNIAIHALLFMGSLQLVILRPQ